LTDADKKKKTFVFHEMKDMYLSFGIYQISYELTFQEGPEYQRLVGCLQLTLQTP